MNWWCVAASLLGLIHQVYLFYQWRKASAGRDRALDRNLPLASENMRLRAEIRRLYAEKQRRESEGK